MLLYPYKENREKPQYFRDLGEKKVCGNNITSHIFFFPELTRLVLLLLRRSCVRACGFLCVCVCVCALKHVRVALSVGFTCFHLFSLDSTWFYFYFSLSFPSFIFFFLVVFLPSNSISGFITSLEFNV